MRFSVDAVLALAAAEARLCRRLVRYWIFSALAILLPLGMYLWHGLAVHRNFSTWSATAAMINPRFFIGSYGGNLLLILLLGVVFLAFDVRSRDRRERVEEVLHSRPIGNVELLLGRLLGVFAVSLVPIVALILLLLGFGWLVGEPVEPVSMVGFVLLMAIPALLFAIGLTQLVAILVRLRLVAALVMIGVIAGSTTALMMLPFYFQPLFDLTGGYSLDFPSDLMRGIAGWQGWAQRLAVTLAGLAAVLFAAALHPRHDDRPRAMRALGGLALLAGGALLIVAVFRDLSGGLEQTRAWRAHHEAAASEPIADIRSIEGSVTIAPGRRLDETLSIRFAAPRDAALDSLLLTVNPGLGVTRVTGGGRDLSYEFEAGLLRIALAEPLEAGAEQAIELELSGRPDTRFAYLSAVKNPLEEKSLNGVIFLLGYEPLIFDARYVALMPGGAWLPWAGTAAFRGDPRTRPRDPFALDLTVDLPEGWLAAGPGAAHAADGAEPGRRRVRFAPGAPVPEAALIAGRLEEVSIEVSGVRCALLLDRRHRANVEALSVAVPEIESWVQEKLDAAREDGLAYPYDGFTLVEVPNRLRGFGGGWRMDSVMAPPGMLLLRESGLPTARWDHAFGASRAGEFEDVEGGMPRAIVGRLETFFDNDFAGGNLFAGASRNFLPYLVAPAGPDAVALDYTLETLTSEQLFDRRGFFSIHLYDSGINQLIGQTLGRWFRTGRSKPIADVLIDIVTQRPEIWDTVLGVSLSELDPWEDPRRTVDVLTLKAGALARSLRDELGREGAAKTLALLRERHLGEPFDRSALVAAGEGAGHDLGPLLSVWLDETKLPAFAVDEGRLARLRDDDAGNPRYQLAVRLRNDGEAPGLVRLSYLAGEQKERQRTAPVSVGARSAVEIGVVLSVPPRDVRVEPYLSLNREPFAVRLPELDEEKIARAEPFEGVRVVPWQPPEEGYVIVDDLDDGFRVSQPERRGWLRLRSRARKDVELDAGLPRHSGFQPPSVWSRSVDPASWGRYRHTAALVLASSEEQRALFDARIPATGRWTLQMYLPDTYTSGNRLARLGRWSIEIEEGSERQESVFEGAAATSGWNDVGEFELEAGDVTVGLFSEERGKLLVADAIRWIPAGGAGSAGGAR